MKALLGLLDTNKKFNIYQSHYLISLLIMGDYALHNLPHSLTIWNHYCESHSYLIKPKNFYYIIKNLGTFLSIDTLWQPMLHLISTRWAVSLSRPKYSVVEARIKPRTEYRHSNESPGGVACCSAEKGVDIMWMVVEEEAEEEFLTEFSW